MQRQALVADGLNNRAEILSAFNCGDKNMLNANIGIYEVQEVGVHEEFLELISVYFGLI